MTNQKNLQKRLLGALVSDLSINSQSQEGKEVALMHVWLSGINVILGTNSYFWQGPSTLIETK
jgi:hypothetical protein